MKIKIFFSFLLLAIFPSAYGGVVKFNVEPRFYYEAAAWLGGGGGPTTVVYKAETMEEAYGIASRQYHDTSCQVNDKGETNCRDASPPEAIGTYVNGRNTNYYSYGIPDYGSGRADAVAISLRYECPTVFNGDYVSPDINREKIDATHERFSCEISVFDDDSCNDCDASGNPVLPSTGQKIQSEADYPTTKTGLAFERTYRSNRKKFLSVAHQGWYGNLSGQGSHCYPAFWRKANGQTEKYCYPLLNSVQLWRGESGRHVLYTGAPGDLQAKSFGQYAISLGSGGNYHLRSKDNYLYVLDSTGRVLQKASADGRVRLLYRYQNARTSPALETPSGLLVESTDIFGRKLQFSYDASDQLVSMLDPASQLYTYEYSDLQRLSKVNYPDGTSRSYLYEAVSQSGCAPDRENLLTGITDEAGVRYATFTYQCDGRAASSEHAGGVYKHLFSYYFTPWPSESYVVDPLGTKYQYNYDKIGEKYLLSWVTVSNSPEPASAPSLGYVRDSHANVVTFYQSGRPTCFEYDLSRDLQTSKVQALPPNMACSTLAANPSNFPATARKTSYEWHPVWAMPERVAEPRLLTTYVYNGRPDPFAGGSIAQCAPASALLPDGSPIAALCKKVEQETVDANGASGFSAPLKAEAPARTWSWTYNNAGQVLTEVNPAGAVTRLEYHAATGANATEGDLKSVTDPSGQVTSYTRYDKHGNVLEQIDPSGAVTLYGRDARQRVTSITRNGLTLTMSYLPTGLLKTLAQPSGYQITYQYDAAHRLTGWQDNRGGLGSYVLDAMGNPIQEQVQDGAGAIAFTLSRTIDAINRVASETAGGTLAADYRYTANSDLASYTNGLSQATSYTYDSLRRLTAERNPQGLQATLAYDARDAITEARDFKGVATAYGRDTLGNATQSTSPDSGSATAVYDSLGLVQSVTDALGRVTQITRDALGRPTQIQSAGSDGITAPASALRYGLSGPEYNAPGSDQGSAGQLSEIADPGVTTRWQRDALGRVTRKVQILANGDTRSVAYSYVPAGQGGAGSIAAITYPSGKQLSHQYDATGRLTGLQWDGHPLLANITWSPLGQPTGWQWSGFVQATGGSPAPLTEQRSYNAAGQLAGSALLALTWDAAGRVSQIQQEHQLPATDGSTTQQATITSVYSYDSAGRLTGNTHTAPAGLLLPAGWSLPDTLGPTSATYAYDANGNRTQAQYSAPTTAGALSTLQRSFQTEASSNRLQSYTETVTIPGSATQTRSVNYQYDASGALQHKGDGNYLHYGADGRLAQVSASASGDSPQRISYTTNSLGQRMFKSDTRPPASSAAAVTEHTVYAEDGVGSTVLGQYANLRSADHAGLPGESDSTEVIYLTTPAGPLPVAAQINGRLYAIDADHLNTPRRLTTPQGQVAWQWLITGFGETPPTTAAQGYAQPGIVNPYSYGEDLQFALRYPGQQWDAETQLAYNLNRYYDPQLGRYVQGDPIGLDGGWNRFAYVAGNPLNFADDEGLQRRAGGPATPTWGQAQLNFQGVSLTNQIRQYQPNYSYSYASAPGQGFTAANIGQLQSALQRLQNGGACVSISSPNLRYDVDAMARAAAVPDRNGLTRAGRAMDKHGAGQRSPDSPFPRPRGGPQQKNADGQFQVEDILTHPGSVFNQLGRGGVGVRTPDGREIRFDADGRFSGFIE